MLHTNSLMFNIDIREGLVSVARETVESYNNMEAQRSNEWLMR